MEQRDFLRSPNTALAPREYSDVFFIFFFSRSRAVRGCRRGRIHDIIIVARALKYGKTRHTLPRAGISWTRGGGGNKTIAGKRDSGSSAREYYYINIIIQARPSAIRGSRTFLRSIVATVTALGADSDDDRPTYAVLKRRIGFLLCFFHFCCCCLCITCENVTVKNPHSPQTRIRYTYTAAVYLVY